MNVLINIGISKLSNKTEQTTQTFFHVSNRIRVTGSLPKGRH